LKGFFIIYTEEYLLDKLQWLKNKLGTLYSQDIDNEPNFPTRKCFVNRFGSLENAFKIIGITNYRKGTFNISDAQSVLDKRNGNFILLNFAGMRNKNLTECKTCGYQWKVSTDSLTRNNTLNHGCPNCSLNEYQKRYQIKDDYIIGETNAGDLFTIDKEDYEKIKQYIWLKDAHGYFISVTNKNKKLALHRLIIGDRKNYIIDHIDGNKSNNRKNNLRYVTKQQNSWNRTNQSNSATKIKGVTLNEGKYRARITYNGNLINLGRYDNVEDAILARKLAENELFGQYARGGDYRHVQ